MSIVVEILSSYDDRLKGELPFWTTWTLFFHLLLSK